MKILTNNGDSKHRDLLVSLIKDADKAILCSGWLKLAGLNLVLPVIKDAANRGATLILYSNDKHTESKATEALRAIPGVAHVIVSHEYRYLHSKLYYFESGRQYTAMVGSANITEGGLVSNEELSVILEGTLGDRQHDQLAGYLNELRDLANVRV